MKLHGIEVEPNGPKHFVYIPAGELNELGRHLKYTPSLDMATYFGHKSEVIGWHFTGTLADIQAALDSFFAEQKAA